MEKGKKYEAFPPAKINLHLQVLGRRKDGYHELETVFQSVDLCDRLELHLRSGSGTVMNVAGAEVPEDSSNLCVRAAAAFAEALGESFRCEISLHKVVPPGAGLGGGSSDAAAVLLILNRAFGEPFGEVQLRGIARKLGADVPFFLHGGVALGLGTGEKLDFLTVDWDYRILLVLPTLRISTRWAYQQLKFGLTGQQKSLIFNGQKLRRLRPEDFRERFLNDFESVIFRHYPQFKAAKEALYQTGAFFASMSGTGSALFGLFRQEEKAREARRSLQKFGRTELVRPVSHADLKKLVLRTESLERS